MAAIRAVVQSAGPSIGFTKVDIIVLSLGGGGGAWIYSWCRWNQTPST